MFLCRFDSKTASRPVPSVQHRTDKEIISQAVCLHIRSLFQHLIWIFPLLFEPGVTSNGGDFGGSVKTRRDASSPRSRADRCHMLGNKPEDRLGVLR